MKQSQRLQILKQKTNSIKKASRQNQLDMRFNSIRKQIIKVKTEQQVQQRRQVQTYLIGELIYRLKENHNDAIFQLWKHCISFSYRYLTQEHILLLVNKLKKLINSNYSRQEDITMGVWLISNWTTTKQKLKKDFQDLIQFLGESLCENLSVKLNQYILFSFANLSTDAAFAKKMIKTFIVNKVLECPTFIEKDSDVALFINNFLQGLNTENHIQENLLKKILQFVKRSLKKSTSDYFLRKDCFCIINKLFNKTNKQQILKQLSPQLKSLMMTIQSITQLESCREMFAMLTIITQIDSVYIGFLDERIQTVIWNCTKCLLGLQNTNNLEVEENYLLIKQIWKFLPYFIKKVSDGLKQQILDWFFQQCLFGQGLEWEEQALLILTQHLIDDDSIIELCDVKLNQFKSIQELTEAMLQALKRVVSKEEGVRKLKSREQLCLCLKSLNFHQNQAISILAREIEEKLTQSTMQEQIQSKNQISQRQ